MILLNYLHAPSSYTAMVHRMKTLLTTLCLFAAFLSACKKQDDESGTNGKEEFALTAAEVRCPRGRNIR